MPYDPDYLVMKARNALYRYHDALNEMVNGMNEKCLTDVERETCKYTIQVVIHHSPDYESSIPRKGLAIADGANRMPIV